MSDFEKHSSIYLVTGKVQGGKTSFLNELVERLQGSGVKVGGFLCPGRFESGERTSFSLEHIPTGEELPMAGVKEHSKWIKYRRFWFNPHAFRKGKIWIRNTLSHEPRVVVIDEVGPMELEGSGWSGLLDQLVNALVPVQLWSVRENLAEEVMERWRIPASNILRIEELEAIQVADLIEGILKNWKESNQTQ